ncbi:MAG: hypothetical protein ACI4GD_02040 [Lachnospiraceae bacterium]
MGLLVYNENNLSKYKGNTDNSIQLQLLRPWKIQPNAATFPLYCVKCKKTQPYLYIHTGSSYGHVGSCQCEYCGETIVVKDHDNIVNSIKTADTEVFFSQLYMLDWKYVAAIEGRYGISVEKELSANLNSHGTSFMTVNELRELIERLIPVKADGSLRFQTDDRFAILPDDINRWIELLYRAGIKLPPNCILIN